MVRYKIHFTDSIGTCTLLAEGEQEYSEIMTILQNNPDTDNIWTEFWDEEEGWQA